MKVLEAIYLHVSSFYRKRGDRTPGLMGLLLISMLITFNLLTINWLPVVFRFMEEPVIRKNLIVSLFIMVLASVYYYIYKIKALNKVNTVKYLSEFSKITQKIALFYSIISILLFAATIIVGAFLRDESGYNL